VAEIALFCHKTIFRALFFIIIVVPMLPNRPFSGQAGATRIARRLMMNTQNITGLIHTLASNLAQSRFGHIARRGIMVINLVLTTFDLWGF